MDIQLYLHSFFFFLTQKIENRFSLTKRGKGEALALTLTLARYSPCLGGLETRVGSSAAVSISPNKRR